MAFRARLDILPAPQRRLWDELDQTPRCCVLYDGTALALRLAHRDSKDFDFFSSKSFEGRETEWLDAIPYLRGAAIQQAASNTLSCVIDRDGPV